MPSASPPPSDPPLSDREPPPAPPAPAKHTCRQRRETLARGMRIGAWRIERELGRGGMATVYAVVHTRFGKRAALKLAHRPIPGRRLLHDAFLREARTSNLIHHAGVPEVFATGNYDRRPFLAMEVLSGRSLGERLEDPMPRDEALEILIELCDVLGAAHAAGVTHRDLKLDNVLLIDVPGADGRRTKLLDWGMARIAGEADPLRDLIAGTLTYVAPEQIRGDDITPAADIYALAVVMYRLLLGDPPFTAPSDLEIIQQHLHEPPPPPRMRWSEIPRELETTLLAMLAKQPEDRPGLPAIVRVLGNALARLRAGKLRPRTQPAASPRHGIGRPNFTLLATKPQRVAGAALGLALTALGLIQLLSA